MNGETRTTRWAARWRRRRGAALAAATVPLLAAIAAAYVAEPTYRATASLRLEGRTPARGVTEAAAGDEAVQHVRTLHQRVLEAERDVGRVELRVRDVSVRTSPDGRQSVSIEFDVAARHADARGAERIVTEAVAQLIAVEGDGASNPVVAPPELEAARLATERLAAEVRTVKADVDAFERVNAGALRAVVADRQLLEQASAALQQAQSERQQLERQSAELEARRIDLDRVLRDAQAASGRRDDNSLSSENLTALQTQWAILRGRHGRDYAPADELAARITRLRSDADRRLAAATAERDTARVELARLEQIHTIEHPDVVAQAHKLSAIESRLGGLRVQGLTNAEIAYIEGLAKERVDIDRRIADAREQHAGVVALIADEEARAAAAPALEQQYLTLKRQIETAQASHDAARGVQESLESELAALRERQPGRLSVAAAAVARRALLTWPPAILAFGAALSIVVALLTVAVMERLDRRMAGVASIRRVVGSRALVVEIPLIRATDPAVSPARA